jgi:hypothetical protein
MKFEYHAGDPEQNRGLLNFLTAQSVEEQRWLTSVFDLCHSGNIRIRPIGAERQEKRVPGLQERACVRVSFTMERWDGNKWVPYIPQKEESLDPTKFVRTENRTGAIASPTERVARPSPGRLVVEE